MIALDNWNILSCIWSHQVSTDAFTDCSLCSALLPVHLSISAGLLCHDPVPFATGANTTEYNGPGHIPAAACICCQHMLSALALRKSTLRMELYSGVGVHQRLQNVVLSEQPSIHSSMPCVCQYLWQIPFRICILGLRKVACHFIGCCSLGNTDMCLCSALCYLYRLQPCC